MTPFTPLRRLPAWPERLAEHLRRNADAPFGWGVNDCCRFAAGAVAAITGCEVLPLTWANRAEAVQALRQLGGLVQAVDSVLPRLPSPAHAWRGDVVLVQTSERHGCRRRWLAVADGDRWWAPSPEGLVHGPLSQAVLAWEVGHA